MQKHIHLVALLLIFILHSCGNTSGETENSKVEYRLISQPDKSFELDYETAFDQIDGKYVEIDGTGYYTFFNRKNNSLYFYNYESGELYHRTQMSKDGPDAIEYPYYFFDYYVHDFDNIFINTIAFYYRINKDGKVLKRIKSQQGDFFTKKDIAIDGATTYANGKLYCGLRVLVPEEGDTSWLRTIYDFENEVFEKVYVDESLLVPNYEEKAEKTREMAKTGGVSTLPSFFVGNEKQLFASSAINDSIYYFEGTDFKKAYYAGDPEIETTNLEGYFNKTKVETFEGGGVSIGPKAIQPAFYTDMLVTPDYRYVYRILIHGTKAKVVPDSDREVPEVFGATLVIFDTQTKTSSKINLPIDELNLSFYSQDVFVSNQGIHFPVKETESESIKSYKVISIATSDTDLRQNSDL